MQIPPTNPLLLPSPIHQQNQSSYQHFRPYQSSNTRNDDRRDFTPKWHEQQSSSQRTNQSMEQRPPGRNRSKDRDRDKDNYPSRRDRGKQRDHDQRKDRDRDSDRDRDKDRDSDRDRNRDRERSRQRTYNDSEDYGRQYNRYSNVNRSKSTFSGSSGGKCDNRINYGNGDRAKSVSSKVCSSLRSSSEKRELSMPRLTDNEANHSAEKSSTADGKEPTERARILEKWCSNFCETSEDITRKLEELAVGNEKECWIRSSPADLFYKRTSVNEIEGTPRLEALCTLFKTELVDRGARARQSMPLVEEKPKKRRQRVCRHKSMNNQF